MLPTHSGYERSCLVAAADPPSLPKESVCGYCGAPMPANGGYRALLPGQSDGGNSQRHVVMACSQDHLEMLISAGD